MLYLPEALDSRTNAYKGSLKRPAAHNDSTNRFLHHMFFSCVVCGLVRMAFQACHEHATSLKPDEIPAQYTMRCKQRQSNCGSIFSASDPALQALRNKCTENYRVARSILAQIQFLHLSTKGLGRNSPSACTLNERLRFATSKSERYVLHETPSVDCDRLFSIATAISPARLSHPPPKSMVKNRKNLVMPPGLRVLTISA